jgi:hypothetical protein
VPHPAQQSGCTVLHNVVGIWPGGEASVVLKPCSVALCCAVMRSAAMWWVLNKHAGTLSDVRGTLRCMAQSESELPLLDRLAVRIAFGYLTALSRPNTSDKVSCTPASGQLHA